MRSSRKVYVAGLLERLVGFPTVAGQPNGQLIAFVSDWLESRGARVTVAASDWRADGYNLSADEYLETEQLQAAEQFAARVVEQLTDR